MAGRVNNFDVLIGQRIRLQRMKANLTQEQVAKALGVSFQQVQKYEKGTNRVSSSYLFRLADLFKVSVDAFRPYDATNGGVDEAHVLDTPLRIQCAIMLKKINDTFVDRSVAEWLEKFYNRGQE